MPVAADRKWADLPRDVLSLIFRKVGAIEVMNTAQWVCRPWRKLTWEPETWRVVDMTTGTYLQTSHRLSLMARLVIIRSTGLVEEFYAKQFADDHLMNFIANRTNGLRRLGLIGCQHSISDESLIEVAKKSPELEYLEIPISAFTEKLVQSVGEVCPQLKHFLVDPSPFVDYCRAFLQRIAFPAFYMKELRYLRLVGCELTSDVLNSILDNCHHLLSLDISGCRSSAIDDRLKKKFCTLAVLILPRNDNNYDSDEEFYYVDPDDYCYVDSYRY